jgi:ABC-type sugar transport system permease subunit
VSAHAKSKSAQVLKALAFILPNLSIFTVFMAVPVLFTLGLAFFRWDPFAGATFVGFDNFNEIFSSKEFWFYMLNTLIFMIGLPLSIIGSLMLASALSIKMRGVLAWRTIYYLPSITNGVALFLLWKVMYNKEAGLINAVLLPIVNGIRALGFADPIGMDGMPDWLKDSWAFPFTLSTIAVAALVAMVIWSFRNLPKPALIISGIIGLALVVLWGGWFKQLFLFLNEGSDQFYLAKSALIFMSVWTYVGGANMILYLAALAGVPTELYEAAEIDGAGLLRVWWDIVLPLCKPALITLAISTFASTWQSFSWPLIVAPGENTRVLAVALKNFSDNQATAYNLLMASFTVMMIPMLLLFIFGQKYFIKGIQLGGVKG